MEKEILAKTNPNVSLFDHSFQVADKAHEMCEFVKCNEKITALSVCAALFHDIGKTIKDFQSYLKGGDKKYEHNIISAKIFKELVVMSTYGEYKDVIERAILYHSPASTSPEYNFDSVCYDICPNEVNDIREVVENFCDFYNKKGFPIKLSLSSVPLETSYVGEYFYPNPHFSGKNKYLLAISSFVRTADACVSSNIDFKEHIKFSFDNKSLSLKIPVDFDKERYETQTKCADEIVKNEKQFIELFAPPGFGKTLIALLVLLSYSIKGGWVAPTNIIAINVYENINSLLKIFGLKDTVSVGLLIKNKWVCGEKKGINNDIIVTNIDNYVRPMFKSDEKKLLSFDLCNRNIVFDEYHAYIGNSSLIACFETALWSRTFSPDTKTILMSATGNPMLYKALEKENLIAKIKPDAKEFSEKTFNVKFCGYKDVVNEMDSIIVRNSVSCCQDVYRDVKEYNENFMCFHSKHTYEDYNKKLDTVIDNHKKNGKKKLPVCATNILCTAIDASFKTLVMPPAPYFEFVQMFGRINRHSEYDYDDTFLYFDESDSKLNNERCAIDNKYDMRLCMYEYNFFKKHLTKDKVSLYDLYKIMDLLYEDEEYMKLYEEVFKVWEKNSFENFSKLTYSYAGKPSSVEIISDKPNIRSEKNKYGDAYVNVFVKTSEMGDGIYLNEEIKESALIDSVEYMKKQLENDCDIAKKYLGKSHKHILKKSGIGKLSKIFINCAKCSDTPFLISPSALKYNFDLGLYSM